MNINENKLPFATALLQSLSDGYRLNDFRADLLSGLTVGIVAVPLAMALAIASGVPPQYGLYTSIVAGILIALTGGSRFTVSGPTAAFVVILLPITHQYGLGGLLITTVMAGVILLIMGLARMGQLIQFIPYPVTTGFTAGIAVVIATLQIKDFFGLDVVSMPEHYLDKLAVLITALHTIHWQDMFIGVITLLVLILWPRLKVVIPGHLVALLIGSLSAWMGTFWLEDFHVATIGSQFSYSMGDQSGQGIPPLPPLPIWPWDLPNATGEPVGISLELIRALVPAAFTVAMLGAIESLLCAVVADGLTGHKHNPNAELVGQGIGNVIAPFFGGIPATAAIARTATAIRTGARSPVAAIVHALVVLLAVVSLAKILAFVPMASLAALLIMVAWNMGEARHFINIVRVAPRSDVVVLLTCFGLTVVFDMVLAVTVGVVLASLLFIHRMTELTSASLLQAHSHDHLKDLPEHVVVYDINGPLFFGAAEKAASVLQRVNTRIQVVIFDMADVPMIDMTGIVALDSLIKKLNKQNIAIVIANLQPNIYRKLLKAGMRKIPDLLSFCSTMDQAHKEALVLRPG